jgi:hypothetical protein
MNLWSRQIDNYNQLKMSNLCLSSKISSVSYPRKAELEFRLPGNGANLLSLQETPLGCRPKVLGNLSKNVFVFCVDGSMG